MTDPSPPPATPPQNHHLLGRDAPPDDLHKDILEESAATLSGGGYRAMLFHLGFLWRMRDAGLLKDIKRFSSVSGGSITAGALALAWDRIDWGDNGQSFRKLVADPLIELSRHTIDKPGAIIGLIPGLNGAWVRRAYDKYVFAGARLVDLRSTPEQPMPRFVFNAASLHTGKLVRFCSEWFAEWTTGRWEVGDISLSTAVAASSAFPPVLAPVVVDMAGHALISDEGAYHPPTRKLYLVDGGVYDNLGIEAVWKRFRTVYVSDAGAGFQFDPDGVRFLPSLAWRASDILMDQIGSLRFRQLNSGYTAAPGSAGHRKGFLVSSDFFINPRPAGGLSYSEDRARELAATKTRLCNLDDATSRSLVNWGYISTDHRLRASGPVGGICDLPYPEYPVR